jgi:hypothetical protein
MSKNLINENNHPVAWERRQMKSDSSAARVAEHRGRKKKQCNVTETKCNAVDTELDTEVDTETDKEQEHTRARKKREPKKGMKEEKRAAPIAGDWHPSARCLELIDEAGIDRTFANMQIREFVFYWQEQGEKRKAWDATFLNRVKDQWERAQKKTPINGQHLSGLNSTIAGQSYAQHSDPIQDQRIRKAHRDNELSKWAWEDGGTTQICERDISDVVIDIRPEISRAIPK